MRAYLPCSKPMSTAISAASKVISFKNYFFYKKNNSLYAKPASVTAIVATKAAARRSARVNRLEHFKENLARVNTKLFLVLRFAHLIVFLFLELLDLCQCP